MGDAIQVISTVGEYRNLLIDRDDVVSVLHAELFPEAPDEVVGWLRDLQTALNRDEYTGDLEAALGIRILVEPEPIENRFSPTQLANPYNADARQAVRKAGEL